MTAVKKLADQLPDGAFDARGKISVHIDGDAVAFAADLHALTLLNLGCSCLGGREQRNRCVKSVRTWQVTGNFTGDFFGSREPLPPIRVRRVD